jgi:hypothetical protein
MMTNHNGAYGGAAIHGDRRQVDKVCQYIALHILISQQVDALRL